MPVALRHPGVYIEEIPSGVRTIVGVGTSITAFVGWAPQGPTDRAYLVQSWADYERRFGGLHADSALSYGVYHFFANGGQQAYIVRLVEYGVAKETVIPVLTFLSLTLAQDIGRVANGLTRPFFGWISDSFGRENTMAAAFGLFAVSIVLMATMGRNPLIFVLMIIAIPLLWGEVYALFPAACTDSFGHKHAATNAGILYTAKGTANLLVPFGPVIISATGH